MIEHSYIMELKYLKQDDAEATGQDQWAQAVEQIRQYAQAPMVKALIKHTSLHLLVVQIRGYKMVRVEEVTLQ